MTLIIILLILWLCVGGLKSTGILDKPRSMEDITRSQLKGYENTQYYKDMMDAARKTDSVEYKKK